MKNRLLMSITAGIALAFCLTLLSAANTSAQSNNPPKRTEPTRPMAPTRPEMNSGKVFLKCEPAQSDVAVMVKITNNTGQTIPQGTKLFYEVKKAGLNGNVGVSGNGLAPNDYIKTSAGGHWTDSAPCTAYYNKK
jgi:hypothetical protein